MQCARFTASEALRRLMNTFKVDGLTRALTRQLDILSFLSFSLGFIGFLSFLGFSWVFLLIREFPISPFLGPPGVRSAPLEYGLSTPCWCRVIPPKPSKFTSIKVWVYGRQTNRSTQTGQGRKNKVCVQRKTQDNIWGTSHPGWPQKGLIGKSEFDRLKKGTNRGSLSRNFLGTFS